jgi:hypothetical protein
MWLGFDVGARFDFIIKVFNARVNTVEPMAFVYFEHGYFPDARGQEKSGACAPLVSRLGDVLLSRLFRADNVYVRLAAHLVIDCEGKSEALEKALGHPPARSQAA